MAPMFVFVVRHGESLAMADPAHVGDLDSGLSPRGRWQAGRIGEWLVDDWITHVVTSPLIRALETATIAAGALGGGIPVTVWPELREGISGVLRGHSRSALAARFPDALLPEEVGEDGLDYGGETPGAIADRAVRVWERLLVLAEPDPGVIIVTHAGLGRALLRHAAGPAHSAAGYTLSPGSITRLRVVATDSGDPAVDGARAEIITLNDTAHLR